MQENIGSYIRKLRTEADMTLTKLAAALDIDQSTLSKIETQKRTLPENLIPRLAQIFQLDQQQLEKEYWSERVAEIIYHQENRSELLQLAERKAQFMRLKKHKQGKLNL